MIGVVKENVVIYGFLSPGVGLIKFQQLLF